jgi:TatD DNase family protein
MFVDSHAHLQWDSFDTDRDAVVRRAANAGVETIVTIGFDLQGSRAGVALAHLYPNVYAAVGLHPHNAEQFNPQVLGSLRRMADDPKVVAIGEIGLDYYRNLSSKQAQHAAFRDQLLLAEEVQLPVVIHDREAHADILKALFERKPKLHGIMHCFSGSKEMAAQCIELGLYVSLAGNVTFPNARRLRELAAWIDLDSMLLETDCPWLAPQPVRGQRNEPAFLRHTAETVAHLKAISMEALAVATTKNVHEAFTRLAQA